MDIQKNPMSMRRWETLGSTKERREGILSVRKEKKGPTPCCLPQSQQPIHSPFSPPTTFPYSGWFFSFSFFFYLPFYIAPYIRACGPIGRALLLSLLVVWNGYYCLYPPEDIFLSRPDLFRLTPSDDGCCTRNRIYIDTPYSNVYTFVPCGYTYPVHLKTFHRHGIPDVKTWREWQPVQIFISSFGLYLTLEEKGEKKI